MTVGVDTDRLRGLVRQRLLGPDAAARIGELSPPQRRVAVRGAVLDVLNEQRVILSDGALAAVMNDVSDEVVGFGPIERLLKDPEVSEVMVNGADDVFVERKGRVEAVEGLWFEGEAQVLHLC
jgi:pilus assembly protein CpaF